MKQLITFIFALAFCLAGFAQTSQQLPAPGTSEYDQLKREGKLPRGPVIITGNDVRPLIPEIKAANPAQPSSNVVCNCMIPIDNTFQVVPMQGGTPPDYRNDDSYSNPIALPFNFCFYGQNQNNCYINNNGNISFGAPYFTFTANAFPDPSFIMIAPFWADVDTRGTGSGLVYYKITPTAMIVRWQTVGYYASYDDKLNDFQLIITDGTDPILPPGNNVSFCYGDMQWTTGDASNGVNGFGGSPATVGVNRGNGVDYIQIGQFDQPGTNYDGPFGTVDQVSWLDNQTFYFDVCNNGSGNNLPPIVNSAEVCDTLTLCVGDTFDFSATFLSPEQGQITSATMTSVLTGLTTIVNTSGNPAVFTGQLVADASNIGLYSIQIVGTDNGTPAASTTANIFVNIVAAPTVAFTFSPQPPQAPPTTVQFTDNSVGAVSWFWDFGDGDTSTLQNPTHTYTSDSVYTVTLTIETAGGCSGIYTLAYLVQSEPIVLPVIAPNVVSPNGDNNNDVLEFTNLADHPNSALTVYNRWGNKIYESSDYRNDWKPNVTDGVYYYVLSGPNLEKVLTGFFHVVK